MLDQALNESLTQTDPGTPMGDLMRRYWQPVGISDDLPAGGEPRQIRVMGEDLVLFRTEGDRGHNGKLSTNVGLLALHCSHRGTSLAYGRVEDGGIRCPFHGWLYDCDGNILEQPAELDGGAYRGHLRHPSYPCQELGGMIFSYLGPPDRMPLLPRYEVLVRNDGTTKVDYYHINSNFIQNVEGALDTVHFSYLHMDRWSQVKRKLVDLPKPHLEFIESNYGIWQRAYLPNVNRETTDTVYAHFFMPAGFVRIQASGRPSDGSLVQKFYSWYVPADDTHTVRFQAAFSPPRHDGSPFTWPTAEPFMPPGPENKYYRDYAGVDTISGIPVNAPGTAIKGYLCQDNMVNESQGPVVDRVREHLTPQDKVLMLMRQIYFKSIEEMRAGRDPKHILRDASANQEYHVHGSEELELV